MSTDCRFGGIETSMIAANQIHFRTTAVEVVIAAKVFDIPDPDVFEPV